MSWVRWWLYRLRWPCFCTHCDVPCKRSHYRHCPNRLSLAPWFIR